MFCSSSLPAPRSVELYGADNLFRGRGLLYILERVWGEREKRVLGEREERVKAER